MIPGLEPVQIRELQALGAPRDWEFEGHLDALPTLTPVRGQLQVEHRGNLLEVSGEAHTIICLCCDRCLNQFNRTLSTSANELIWLGERDASESMAEQGLDMDALDGLVECLDPRSSFEPEQCIFEHLSLQLPAVNFCGDGCPGMPRVPNPVESSLTQPVTDPRWAALLSLRSDGGEGSEVTNE